MKYYIQFCWKIVYECKNNLTPILTIDYIYSVCNNKTDIADSFS